MMGPEQSDDGEAPPTSASSGPDIPDEEELGAGGMLELAIIPPWPAPPLPSWALVRRHLALAF